MAEPVDDARTSARVRETAFAEAYDRFGPSLFRTAAALLGCRAEAEDAVQDVFVGLAKSGHDLAAMVGLRAYLFAALRHAVSRRASQRRRRDAVPFDDVAEPVARTSGPTDDRADRLHRAVWALAPEQREVIALKIDGDLTFAEIGAALGISPNTAASRYRYALEKLRAALGEE